MTSPAPLAAVLAAGASSRMGRPKALLPFAGGTFLSAILGTLRAAGIRRTLVVTGADEAAVAAEAARLGAAVRRNEGWERGRFSSVREAARTADGAPLLLWPVDCPAVSAGTVRALLSADPGRDAVPVHAGRGGHPVLLSGATSREIAAAPADANLRDFLRARRVEVPVDDAAVLDDVDTAEEYEALLARAALVAVGEAAECAEPEAFVAFARLVEAGEPAALVTVVAATGSVPRGPGAAMAVRADGTTAGTVGGGKIEHEAIRQARLAIADGRPRRLRYDFTAGPGRNLEMACAGTAELFVMPAPGGPSLVVFGAGHVSRALVPMARAAGYRAAVLDDRPGEPAEAAFPPGVARFPGPYAESLSRLEFRGDSTFAVVVTHGHERDLEALLLCLARPWRYLGMIGSRAKVAKLFAAAREAGAAADRLAAVRAPVGLDLGGRAPGEIAVSILAEMQAVRHGRAEIRPLSAPGAPREEE